MALKKYEQVDLFGDANHKDGNMSDGLDTKQPTKPDWFNEIVCLKSLHPTAQVRFTVSNAFNEDSAYFLQDITEVKHDSIYIPDDTIYFGEEEIVEVLYDDIWREQGGRDMEDAELLRLANERYVQYSNEGKIVDVILVRLG